jgi:2-dehydropantoate 2-reductase
MGWVFLFGGCGSLDCAYHWGLIKIPERNLKFAVLGAGALGSAMGGVLTEAGHDVWLITRNQAHVDAIHQRGLTLRTDGVDRIVKAQAATHAIAAGTVDCVVVLVKSAQTRAAMESAMSLLGPDTSVLSLQNGLGHEEILSDIVGRQRVLAGKSYCGGQMVAPGHVICGTRGKDTHMGELDGAMSPRILRVAGAFRQAGLETIVSDNILGTIWDKLFINVATGALSGITRLAYGDLYQVPALRDCAVAAVTEAMAVAKARGVRTSITDPLQAWTKAGAGLPYEFKASVLQTLERGVRTEVDYINGAVVQLGLQHGVPTPVNATLLACIKGLEQLLPPSV